MKKTGKGIVDKSKNGVYASQQPGREAEEINKAR